MAKVWRAAFRAAAPLLAIAMTLATAQPEVPEPPEWIPEGLINNQCLAHEFSVPPQGFHVSGSGFHVSGSVGGMKLGPIVFTAQDGTGRVAWLQPSTVEHVLSDTGALDPLSFDVELTHDVAIVVADDFANGHFKLPPALFTLKDSVVDNYELLNMVTSGNLSHGALVMHHLNRLIAASGSFLQVHEAADGGHTVWTQNGNDKTLVVVALDMSVPDSDGLSAIKSGAVFDVLKGGLATRIDYVESLLTLDFPSVVVNMSWVFLPCETVEDFIDNLEEYRYSDQYLQDLELPDDVDIATLVQALAVVRNQDLSTMFSERSTLDVSFDVAFVAASGNFALDYQMLPASWPQVIGVGVTSVRSNFPPSYANRADVTVPGEWLQLESSAGEVSEISYAGTSFAAPFVALMTALDMASKKSCHNGWPNISELLKPVPTELFYDPGNEPLAAAVDTFCRP